MNVYEHELKLIDSLKPDEVPVLICHGLKHIAPWGELLSTRAEYLKAGGCITDGSVRDVRMIREMGFCKGIENYSRHFSNRPPGAAPACLLDYFPDDFLFIIDESHQTLPQLHAMYNGDRSRKESLIEFGFRLPSAFDNRPLKFEESYKKFHQAIYVSATPGPWEIKEANGEIRYEFMLDPYDPIDITDTVFMAGLAKKLAVDAVVQIDISYAVYLDEKTLWEEYKDPYAQTLAVYRMQLSEGHETSQLRTTIRMTVVDRYANTIYDETRFLDTDSDQILIDDRDLNFDGGVSPKLLQRGLNDWLNDWVDYLPKYEL